MTREQAKKYAPLIEAFGNGEIIQIKDKWFGWLDVIQVNGKEFALPEFQDAAEYRIKPKPREFYICFHNKYQLPTIVTPEQFVNSNIDFVNDGWNIIHVVEKDFNPYK